jgi:hypothetical protein
VFGTLPTQSPEVFLLEPVPAQAYGETEVETGIAVVKDRVKVLSPSADFRFVFPEIIGFGDLLVAMKAYISFRAFATARSNITRAAVFSVGVQ